MRANTSAERFALVAQAQPRGTTEFDQLIHDIMNGFLRLSEELNDLAVEMGDDGRMRLDIDPRIRKKFEDLSGEVADLIEPARNIRTMFRAIYAAYIDPGSDAPVLPQDPDFFRK